MPNSWELSQCQTLAHGPNDDPDADGATMAVEYQQDTNPCHQDTDGDGMPDAWEVSHGFDPLNANDAAGDADGDGLTNLQEHQIGTDPHNTDTDNDGLPDMWEHQNSLDPLSNDANGDLDNDGVSNAVEYDMGFEPDDPNDKPAVYQFDYDNNGNMQEMRSP